jgi:hypothetical protein
MTLNPTFATSLTLREVDASAPGLEAPPGDFWRRFRNPRSTFHYSGRAAGWAGDDDLFFVVDDGVRSMVTPVTSKRVESYRRTIAGDGVLTIAKDGREIAEVGFDGTVRARYAASTWLSDVVELADNRLAIFFSLSDTLAIFEPIPGGLRVKAAFAAPTLCALRSIAAGRLLAIGFQGALEVWWIEKDQARVVARFEGFQIDPLTEVGLDATGTFWVQPEWPGVWDGGTGYEIMGIAGLLAAPELSRFAAAPTTELPQVVIKALEIPPALEAAALPAAQAQRSIPKVDAAKVSDPYVAAFVRAIQTGPARAEPDPALVEIASGRLPRALGDAIRACVWQRTPQMSLGEFWWETPSVATDAYELGSARDAIRIGTIANGDVVVARIAEDEVEIVELSHEEDAEYRRGDLPSFLRHCVAHARKRGEATSLDPFLPADDRDGG